MSYTLFSNDGPVDHIASIQGLADVVEFINRLRVWGPLKEFLDNGETYDVQGCIKDITQYIPYATNPDVKSTLLTIQNALQRAKGWAAIGD